MPDPVKPPSDLIFLSLPQPSIFLSAPAEKLLTAADKACDKLLLHVYVCEHWLL